jgi:hypothetical protein
MIRIPIIEWHRMSVAVGKTISEADTAVTCIDGAHAEVDDSLPGFEYAAWYGTAGLGDMLAAGLEFVGITKERVAAALRVKDCGCEKRQESLNAIGRKIGIGFSQSHKSAD